MRLQRFDSPAQFYEQVAPFLLHNEAANCLPLGMCTQLMSGYTWGFREPYMAVVSADDRQVIGAALMTPPYDLILTQMTDLAAVDLIAADVHQLYPYLPGTLGTKPVSRYMVEHWQARTGQGYRLSLAERIYQLETVIPVQGVAGTMRPAAERDRALIGEWFRAFNLEALGHGADDERVERWVTQRLNSAPVNGAPSIGMYLWEVDGETVSMVGYAGLTPNGIRVAPVYTPPALRGRGYASALTAAVSQTLLNTGRKYCFLFTDLANPTSNKIYQQVGYVPVIDIDQYAFNDPED